MHFGRDGNHDYTRECAVPGGLLHALLEMRETASPWQASTSIFLLGQFAYLLQEPSIEGLQAYRPHCKLHHRFPINQILRATSQPALQHYWPAFTLDLNVLNFFCWSSAMMHDHHVNPSKSWKPSWKMWQK